MQYFELICNAVTAVSLSSTWIALGIFLCKNRKRQQ